MKCYVKICETEEKSVKTISVGPPNKESDQKKGAQKVLSNVPACYPEGPKGESNKNNAKR